MGLLNRIEESLEAIYGRIFRRNQRDPTQPIEIGRAILRSVDEQKRISIAHTYAPNCFKVFLPPDQINDLASMERTLVREIKGVLRSKAEKENLSFIGDMSVVFQEDPKLLAGQIKVAAEFAENGNGTNEPSDEVGDSTEKDQLQKDTIIYARPDSHENSNQHVLVYRQGEKVGDKIPLVSGLLIGRDPVCSLVLSDRNISRIHAAIREENGQWVIYDQGSTNGTFVNGERISQKHLNFGDQIRLGKTVLSIEESSHD